jgi:hypothetical protein
MRSRASRVWVVVFNVMACGAVFGADVSIVCPPGSPPKMRLAVKEIRRYVYLRTGRLLPLAEAGKGISVGVDPSLEAQQFRLKTEGDATIISGGSDVGVLYGAYRYAELLGVRFYLHGDVVPDQRLKELPAVDETGKPLFTLRGVNPWGSHPFGFDAWNADDYKVIFTQLAKMRMNFLGVHCYPEGHPYAEPTVWHGLAGDFDATGQVSQSYVSRYFNTLLTPAWGGYRPRKTGDYGSGGALLFDRDDWAPPAFVDHCPLPSGPRACNQVFNRMAEQFRDAFTFARRLGVKTCIGTEAPLVMPAVLRQRLQAQGKNPADPAAVREVYEGTFRRIMASHPLDYSWIWTPEGWTWQGNNEAQYAATVADIHVAQEALKNVHAPFKLATCGWVLGPVHDRAAFDRDLPKDVPISAISRAVGHTPVDPAYARIEGREKWAIPWLESDGHQGLAGIQLYAGRMRRDAADAAEYGCTGLMGLHWRTDILAPNVSALAQAAWDQRRKLATAGWRVSGNIANYPNARIAGTADPALYRSCRYDLGTITLAAPNGKYRLTLKFCEPHFKSPGERIFDVKLQGREVLTGLDIFGKVGQFAALDFTLDDIAIDDGRLTIELVARKSLPCISAVAVEGAGFSSKVNCGGEAYQDWQVDSQNPRDLPCGDFYLDWSHANFGSEAAVEIARVYTDLDGKVPLAAANGCPVGPLTADATLWSTVNARFRFVDDLEELRGRVRGAGNLERFDYWLDTFRYYRSLARVRCALAGQKADGITQLWGEAYRSLLATVNTPGGMAMVVNMENHPGWGLGIAKYSGQPWPHEYTGRPRLIVPTVRSVATRGEVLKLKIIALDRRLPVSVAVHVRPLGQGIWEASPATHVARGMYEAKLPAAEGDFEYFVTAEMANHARLVWPVTSPAINQTVLVLASEGRE